MKTITSQRKLNIERILFFAILFFGFAGYSQSPELMVKGEESEKVRLSQLLVNVKVVGNIAYTTAEMHFFNSSNRQMEAELIFPLPEGVSVSRYAIDINGKMREAVPVNKNKGKQVFEAIEHRRVDPGLLEKVDGNNFKTRIYPLMPNGERIVIIGYEEELSAFDKNNLAYQLVSRYPKKLDKFEINVSVLGTNSAPIITEKSVDEISFSKWDQSFQASVKKENYQPTEKILFKIPIQENAPSVIVQTVNDQHYFYGNTFLDGNKIAKKLPNSIGLIWDVSLSYKSRDLKKELDLLNVYFQKIKNVKISLYFLGYTFEKKQDFTITNGNWQALYDYLKNAKYDGGTRYSQLNLPNHDEYLFFTDGLSSLSENTFPKIKKPLYAITSSASADFAFLNYSSVQTGGNLINLNQLNIENALDKLVNNNLKFLGIKENYTITDLYPMVGTSVSGSFSFAGISLKPQNEMTLLFGYENGAILERKITLEASAQNSKEVNIEKLWAQKKIANLELQYSKNAEEIESLGKKFGIITKNTSLIVLEDIRDYIAYDIVPPAELRAEFDQIKKQEHENRLAEQKNNWENVESYFTELNSWWKKDIKYVKPKPAPKPKKQKQNTNSELRNARISSSRNQNVAQGFVSGVVLEGSSGIPLPGALVSVNGEITETDLDGKFTIKATENASLIVNYIAFERALVTVGRNNYFSIQLQESSDILEEVMIVSSGYDRAVSAPVTETKSAISASPPSPPVVKVDMVNPKITEDQKEEDENEYLQEVVVQGYVSQTQKSISYAVQTISSEEIKTTGSTNFSNSLQGKVAGVIVNEIPNNDTIAVRSMASLTEANEPLIVVDGSVFNGKLDAISADEIAFIDVLKGNSATAIYGSRGANGVIVVKTKNGNYNEIIAQNEAKEWSPDRLYLKALASVPKEKQYELYLELRKMQEQNPSYYFDVAHFFYNQGNLKMALQVLSNIADLGLENHQLYKTLTYTLRQWEAKEDALFTAKQIVKWREHEPQSHRELALAYEDNKQFQNAFDELIKALDVNYYGEMSGQYEGVEDIILMDINRLTSENKSIKTGKLDEKYLEKMPVDIRIIMNWNQMDTDLDLHIIEPNGEECYYAHESTEAGARFSKDFTEGYGPEQYLIRNAIKGKYQIKTNYFGENALTENGPATVMVEIYTTKAGKTSKTLKTIQLGKIKENEILAEIIW